MKKRILSLLLVCVMLLGCMPMLPIFAVEEDKIISRYSDAVASFVLNKTSETHRNNEMSADDYKAFLRDPNNFSVSFGDTAWKVGLIQHDGTFVPFTRVMAMAADNGEGKHDTNWVSTEEAYESRIDAYVDGTGSVNLWNGSTPLWYVNNAQLNGLTTGGGTTLISAMVYTVEEDCTVTFSVESLNDSSSHSMAILVDGVMIWPVAGASLADATKFKTIGKNMTAEALNVEMLSVAGTELKAGQEVAFAIRGAGDSIYFNPVISEYVAGQTAITLADPFGDDTVIISAPDAEFVLPEYTGSNIFLGWDSDGDGVADMKVGDTFIVPNKASVTITACVVESSAFAYSYPTLVGGQVTFRDNWIIGRLDLEYDEFQPYANTNGEHIYTDTGMWGNSGGGFYLSSGMIAMSGCYADGPYAVSLRTEVAYAGTVVIDFDRLEGRRQLNTNEFADSTTPGGHVEDYLEYDFAIYKNGVKIFPTEGDYWHWKSDKTYNSAYANEDMADNFRELVGGALTVDVMPGDTFEFRIRQGNEACWMFYCDPNIRYTALSANPRVEKAEIMADANEIALDFIVNTLMADEGATNGLLVWTEGQTKDNAVALTAVADENGMTRFRYNGFTAKQMTDTIYVMPYSETADKTVYGKTYEYTVQGVADAMLENLDGAARNFLVALLNYGAQAQNVFGYKNDTPANGNLDRDEREPSFDFSALQDVYAQNGEGSKVKSVSLICGSKLGFKFMTDAVEGATAYQIEIATNADFTDSTTVDMINAAEGSEKKAIVYIDGADLGATFYIRVVVDGNAGATLTYSIQTYMARMMNDLDDNMYYLVQSLVLLAEAYAA